MTSISSTFEARTVARCLSWSLVHVKQITGPEFILRFNEYNAGAASSTLPGLRDTVRGRFAAALEDVLHQTMPAGMGFSYEGMSFQEQRAAEGVPSWMIFGLSLLIVFLVLAALYGELVAPVQYLVEHTDGGVRRRFAFLWLRRWLSRRGDR